jgi:hypothetical protein
MMMTKMREWKRRETESSWEREGGGGEKEEGGYGSGSTAGAVDYSPSFNYVKHVSSSLLSSLEPVPLPPLLLPPPTPPPTRNFDGTVFSPHQQVQEKRLHSIYNSLLHRHTFETRKSRTTATRK